MFPAGKLNSDLSNVGQVEVPNDMQLLIRNAAKLKKMIIEFVYPSDGNGGMQ